MKSITTTGKKKTTKAPVKKIVALSKSKKMETLNPPKMKVVATPAKKKMTTAVSGENKTGIQNHKTAIKHHEEAVKHHREAVKHHEAGNHKKAAESKAKAHGFLGFLSGLWEKM